VPGTLPTTNKRWLTNSQSHRISYSTVKHLALRGATVHLRTRNEQKALDALKSLEAEVAAAHAHAKDSEPALGKIIYHHCDIGTPAKAREAAEREDRVGCAGCVYLSV
jgi:NAD(P)-dependent dehydrogenase (short-subunit alcohol dehydrogenase family)